MTTSKAATKKTATKKTATKKTASKKTASKKTATKKTATKKTATKKTATSTLKRPLQPMPAWIERALQAAALDEAYAARPAYQRNDWLAWITRAKQETTQQKRLKSMLEELKAGHGYMGMAWSARS